MLQFNPWKKNICFIFVFLFLFFYLFPAKAQLDVTTYSPKEAAQSESNWLKDALRWYKWLDEKVFGSKALNIAIRNALNKIAYDTATWIGSGGKGKQPLFVREGWKEYLFNIGDEAAGDFLEQLGRDKNFFGKFNLCNPNLGLKISIGLGIKQTYRPGPPACTFSQLLKNWNEEINRDDFLNRFQTMFEPSSNDLGIALTLHTGVWEDVQLKNKESILERIKPNSWIPKKDTAGRNISPPNWAEGAMNAIEGSMTKYLGEYTGHALTDAANVFLNQLAYTLFQNLLGNIGSGKHNVSSPYDWDQLTWLYDYDSSYSYKSNIAAVQSKIREIIEPKFNVRGDYNILQELTMCPDPTKAGPTNCVITDKFREAIINKLTVAQAIEQGYLNGGAIFGFNSNGLEPAYNEGYPYRSMIILRKFRIIPVGWEIAAQYIKNHSSEIGGTKSLSDLVACYSATDEYNGYYASWCEGLVDPSWVLKAPLNYCRREGPGPEIISSQIVGNEKNSQLVIRRNNTYCADEQTCIKENNDGSCEIYGYCTEERRKWNFGNSSCDPKYNTCQTFRKQDGTSVSFLSNTLNYSNCSAENAGCLDYCQNYNYTSDKFECTLTSGDKVYLDRDAEKCDSNSEGCHQFVRTKSGVGANLMPNSSFENPDLSWDIICDGDSLYGNCSAHLSSGFSTTVPLFDISPISLEHEAYTFSVYVKGCGEGGEISIGSNNSLILDKATSSLKTDDKWRRFSVSHIFLGGDKIIISIQGITDTSGSCRIDGIKVERGMEPTHYNDYLEEGVVYEKLIPDYLASECYVNPGFDYRLKDNHPAECENYVRFCNAQEVGCNLFTSLSTNISIPAKANITDYCSSECVGYNEYLQSATYFDSQKLEYFIPDTARKCNAQSVGCDEFTNLDKLNEGGEAKEYFTYLRQCVKPTDPTTTCAEFYVWEGSDETGYQLKVLNLKVDDDSDDASLPDPGAAYSNDPAVIEYDYSECNETIYNLPATDPSYNPDCRAFYNKNGEVSYHLYKNTISCSDNCHPYRRTENNIDSSLTDAVSCTAAGSGYSNVNDNQFHWDSIKNICYFCKNGGVWNSQYNACIYMAIPEEGQTCSVEQNGCREYTGNTGNNIKTIIASDFEGSLQNWSGSASVSLSNEALSIGGNSLLVTGSPFRAEIELGYLLHRDSSYHLTFLAKTNAPVVTLRAYIDNGSSTVEFLGDFSLKDTDWQIVNFNLDILNNVSGDFVITPNTKLVIYGNNDFYLDDVRLTEIVDRYYLIKNSWQTPDSCFKDLSGNPVGPFYNLGCDIYKDQNNNTYYLRKFSQLCQESAVGCELMIDTHNYTPFKGNAWNDGGDGSCDLLDDDDCITVDRDNFVFVVYDQSKFCSPLDKGCQRLGKPFTYGLNTIYKAIYLKNNPDDYDKILCNISGVGCEEWSSNDGLTYFKDPGNMVCEWRQKEGEGMSKSTWGWYKKKIKRCDDGNNGGVAANGVIETNVIAGTLVPKENNICLSDSDCGATGLICNNDDDCGNGYVCVEGKCHYPCILDNNDYECPVVPSPDKTIGYGGPGSVVYQPNVDVNGDYWVGLCPISEAGCTEYIDPISRFSPNIVFNYDFSQDVDGDSNADGWESGSQYVKLAPNTLYILSATNNNISITPDSGNAVFKLLEPNNQFSGPVSTVSVSAFSGRASRIFYTNNNVSAEDIKITVSSFNIGSGKVELKKAIVDYQLKQNVDKTTCNGVVDFENGCVLFDERDQIGSNLSGLLWDSDLSYLGANSPNSGINIERDSNILLKVNPDRVCDKWLACRSFVKDEETNSNVCFDIGLCDSFDDNGNCNNFIVVDNIIQAKTNLPAGTIDNMSGYVKVGYDSNDNNSYYPLSSMRQIGEIINVPNGNFEIKTNNNYPLGWIYPDGNWNESLFKIINSPVEAQKEGIEYTPEGKQFLKLGYKYIAESEYIEVEPNTMYNLSIYINTLNLVGGKAIVRILFYDKNGNLINKNDIISLDNSYKWINVANRFFANSNIQRIKIRLLTDNAHSGVVYFDDIKIKSALKVRDDKYISQSCRLYPKEDSLSCDYYEDSGLREKGWPGYCLEHDRYPGAEDACLMWYPVDRVKGDGIEEGAGYQDKMPLYYCMNFMDNGPYELVEYRPPSYTDGGGNHNTLLAAHVRYQESPDVENACQGCCDTTNGTYDGNATYTIHCPAGYSVYHCSDDQSAIVGNKGDDDYWFCYPSTNYSFNGGCGDWTITLTPSKCNDYWYKTDGDLQAMGYVYYDSDGDKHGPTFYYDEAHDGLYYKVRNVNTCEMYDLDEFSKLFHCTWVTQTVTPTGQNKYWANRVFEGANYQVPGLKYTYSYTDKPFGSIVPPKETENNPYNWTTPLDLDKNFISSNGGAPYSCEGDCTQFGLCSISRTLCYRTNIDLPFGCVSPRSAAPQTISPFDCPPLETCETPFPIVGKNNGKESLKRLFAQSYGTWKWDSAAQRYIPISGEDWDPPTEACTIKVSQPSWGATLEFPTAFTTNQTAAEFYNYTNASFNNPSFYSFIVADRSELFVHYSLKTGKMSVVFFHDYPNSLLSPPLDSDGGNVAFTFTNITSNNVLAVKDDPGITNDPVTGGKDVGSEIEAGDIMNWSWGQCCTDGGMIEMPNSSWSITINPSFVSGINNWVFLYTDNNGSQQTQSLNMNEPVTLSFNDYCAVVPEIKNIKVDNNTSLISYKENEFVNLTFNTYIGPAQLPLVMYAIDWGDNEKTIVSGIEMNSRPNIDKPHSLYHLYNYWDMLSKKSSDQTVNGGENTVYCGQAGGDAVNYDGYDSGIDCPLSSNCCIVKPKIKIKDNWGWCNQGTTRNDCIHWDEFTGWVMITEK